VFRIRNHKFLSLPDLHLDPDPDPGLLVRDTYPKIRIRTKMSRIGTLLEMFVHHSIWESGKTKEKNINSFLVSVY
jgi:hypothetical protein